MSKNILPASILQTRLKGKQFRTVVFWLVHLLGNTDYDTWGLEQGKVSSCLERGAGAASVSI